MKREEMKYNTILSPFKWFILENFPYIEEDFDALTNWQLFCKLGKEMNKIIEKVNLTGEQVELLTNSFNDLKNYVDNYFENLDVQEEINEKLDDMVEQGTLQEIISEYLNSTAVFGFNTVSDMKSATNLIDGSFARTYGKTTLNDRQGAFYKIREIKNTDIVDENNIVAITYDNTLVAEKIIDVTFENLNELTARIRTDEVSNYKNFKGKVCYFADSYGNTETCPTNWCDELTSLLGLTSSDVFLSSRWNGSGFIGGGGAPTWPSELSSIVNQTTQEERNEVSAIIIGGGFNDRNKNDGDLLTAMQTFNTVAKANFPNAQIYLAMIGWTIDNTTTDSGVSGGYIYNLQNVLPIYSQCGQFGWKFLENCQYVMHDFNYFQADKVHPNANGSKAIASAIFSALNGNVGVHKKWTNLLATNLVAPFIAKAGSNPSIKLDNDIITAILSTANGTGYATQNRQDFTKNVFYPLFDIINGFGVSDQYRPILKTLTIEYENTSQQKIPFNALVGFNNGQFGFIPLETINTNYINIPRTEISFSAMQL